MSPGVSSPADPPEAVNGHDRTTPSTDRPKPRHDEKVTFYCTGFDLDRLERARLELRTNYRIASDRGRIVRAALTEILDDFEARGESSALVRRLGPKP